MPVSDDQNDNCTADLRFKIVETQAAYLIDLGKHCATREIAKVLASFKPNTPEVCSVIFCQNNLRDAIDRGLLCCSSDLPH